jgi:dolichyl-phosphate beta-glucosyltransferase
MIRYSVVVPLYNEEKRLKDFVPYLIEYLGKKYGREFELLLVDDGSSDNTVSLLKSFSNRGSNIKILDYKPNHGKGYAVKYGIMRSTGEYIVFIDADGSIPPEEIPTMFNKLKMYDVVVGDRSSEESKVEQPPSRKAVGIIFNLYVNMLFFTGVTDHLCGFKGFKRKYAIDLFKDLKSSRWVFDVELFYMIRKRKYSLYCLPIKWVHKGESKMKFTDPFKMFIELLTLRFKI